MASYAIDHSAILYLAQMGADHTNVYRFSMMLTEPVCPRTLQKAADRFFSGFPPFSPVSGPVGFPIPSYPRKRHLRFSRIPVC